MFHFVEGYRGHIRRLIATHPLKTAMAMAVGGEHDYEVVGKAEADLLQAIGLEAGHALVDLGCGSGRLSGELGRRLGSSIDYVGVDMVPELLDYARTQSPSTFRFEVAEKPPIPAPDASADFVGAFSLLTHLLHEESYLYLRDAVRVVKPGGRIVFSFMETGRHWDIFEAMAASPGGTFTIFIERPMIEVWGTKLNLTIEAYDPYPFGQSVVVLRR